MADPHFPQRGPGHREAAAPPGHVPGRRDPPRPRRRPRSRRALVVADGYAMWHDGILDTETGRFAYHTFHRNQRVARIAQPHNVIRTEAR